MIVLPFGFLPFILHHYRKYTLSKLYVIIFIPFLIFLALLTYGNESGIQYIFLTFIFAIVAAYEKWTLRILNILYVVILVVTAFIYNTYNESLLASSVGPGEDLFYMGVTFLFVLWVLGEFYSVTFNQAEILAKKNTELASQNHELQILVNQNNLKTKLLSVLTHDLRGSAYTFNNLTKKINFLIKKNETDKLLKVGSHFEQQGEKLIHNIENLLAWIISQQEYIDAEYDDLQLRKIVEKIIENLYSPAVEKSIVIINKIDDSISIQSDVNILKIILQNLIHNSIKYSPKNSKIIIDLKTSNGFYNIIITDEGKGMDQEKIDLLHNNFKKINGKITQEGYGIGLSICFSFIKVLKGKLIFQKREEKGLQVTIQLPKQEKLVLEMT